MAQTVKRMNEKGEPEDLEIFTDDDGKRFVRITKGGKKLKVFLPKTRAEKILEWDAPIEPNTVEMEDINF